VASSNLSLKNEVSSAEWEARVNLAAAYRLVALFGWDDLVFTHISARVPGPEHHFLINPYGLMFDEITASSLVKVDLNGRKVVESPMTSTRLALRSIALCTRPAKTRCA
jgi:ribulose-5-phosphate 4-epimerase/fuculose-1-phosphate aldolase